MWEERQRAISQNEEHSVPLRGEEPSSYGGLVYRGGSETEPSSMEYKWEEDKEFNHQPPPAFRWKAEKMSLLTTTCLLALSIFFGAANRVSFRLMQYSMVNYLFPLLVITITFSVAINFFVVLIKLLFTNHITPQMHKFPKWKFFVMGSLDGLSLLFILVGGAQVSGIKQLILLQATVPATMIFSILLLRYRGNHICCTARAILDRNGVNYTELYLGEDVIVKAEGIPLCRLYINGRDIGDIPSRLHTFKPPEDDIIEGFLKYIKHVFTKIFNRCCSSRESLDIKMVSLRKNSSGSRRLQSIDKNEALETLLKGIHKSELDGEVLLFTDAHSWRKHFKRFYSPIQYLAALVIAIGVALTVMPRILEDFEFGSSSLLYLCFTIPAALSSIYKEIVFRTLEMDVWYLSAFTSLAQLLMTFFYITCGTPGLVALTLSDMPENFKNSLQCLFGENIISRADGYDCLVDPVCGYDIYSQCCDVCDSTINSEQAIASGYIVLFESTTSLLYNLTLTMVIKHGSAALMYIAVALVLPLGSIAFHSNYIMGIHATPFTVYTLSGLAVVLFGIILYRGVDWCWRQDQAKKWKKKEGGSYYGIPGFP
eukprot:TRINITY_DN7778_c0_g1_i1.p1 TRINITY_DN7778_c0_g1~~TRINITY_DN7778_c0_g1_i1.p1  ORF type:complete len:597 (-),score=88.48 TRINITY_DN7778_c0_g1_i1:185-1975(-)